MKKVTIQEVAKELNLSRNTVAKALNNSDTVAYETRYIVIKKAYEMGYSKLLPVVLNEFKIKDRLSEVKTIAVLARRELSTFWNRMIMGISDELNKNNCKLQFHFIGNEEEEELKIPTDMELELHGILLLSVFEDSYVQKIASLDAPIVFLEAPEDMSKVSEYGDILLFGGENSIRKMTEQMIEEGARRLAFIGDITYSKSMQERFQGFTHAVAKAGLEEDRSLYKVDAMPYHYNKEEEVVKAVESFSAMPDGIVCGTDEIAKDVIAYLKKREIKIPQEVMVSGFGHKEEPAAMMPALTTANIDDQRLGRRLVQQLIWRIENPEMPYEVITASSEVIYQDSTVREK